MPIPCLSEATIRRYASTKSFQRGEDYYHSEAVAELIERGNTLSAEVEGSEAFPYRVSLNFDRGGITNINTVGWGASRIEQTLDLLAFAFDRGSSECFLKARYYRT